MNQKLCITRKKIENAYSRGETGIKLREVPKMAKMTREVKDVDELEVGVRNEVSINIVSSGIIRRVEHVETVMPGDIMRLEIQPAVLNSQQDDQGSFARYIELLNPWQQPIFSRWLNYDRLSFFETSFPKNLISGIYTLRYSNLTDSVYWFFYHQGRYNNLRWYIEYSLELDSEPTLEIRLALPQTRYPYFVVNHLEYLSEYRLTTDGTSQWLVADVGSTIQDKKRITVGYRAWVTGNYFLFSPMSLAGSNSGRDLRNDYLKSEPGIETADSFVRDFGDGIAGKSTISLLYQISHRIHAHLKY
ncbi:MAG TPA: hypothetical protein VJ044_15550, partial [Candidatus Hodarchaeales archaeon]|nr:hypothetical protein [Candidatus Hodarchaeales archaeon]